MPETMTKSSRIVPGPIMRIAETKPHPGVSDGAGDPGRAGQKVINDAHRYTGVPHLVDLCQGQLVGRAVSSKIGQGCVVRNIQDGEPFNVREREATAPLQGVDERVGRPAFSRQGGREGAGGSSGGAATEGDQAQREEEWDSCFHGVGCTADRPMKTAVTLRVAAVGGEPAWPAR